MVKKGKKKRRIGNGNDMVMVENRKEREQDIHNYV